MHFSIIGNHFHDLWLLFWVQLGAKSFQHPVAWHQYVSRIAQNEIQNGTYRKNVNCWSNYNWSVKDMDAQNVDFMLFFPIESCFPPFSNRLWKRSENGSENQLKSARESTLRLKKAENGSQKLKNWTWKRVNGAWLLEDGSHVARSEAGMGKKASQVPGPRIRVHQCRRTRPACTTSAGCPAGLPREPGRDVVQIYR